MKILGKNVIVGTKKLCTEYISKLNTDFNDCYVGSNEYKGNDLEKNVVFIRDKKGYLIEVNDFGSFPTLSLICYGAATRWKTYPKNAGDYYVDDIKPYFDSKINQETLFDFKTLLKILTTEKKIEMEEQQISIN